jgi:ribosome-associated heat shock protein Hsp15
LKARNDGVLEFVNWQSIRHEKSFPSKALIAPKGKESRVATFPGGFTFCQMEPGATVRIDKWLWAVRLYRSRSLATAACNAGHVKIAGQNVKPSREVHGGETISALCGHLRRTVRVTALLNQRVGAKLVSSYLEDQTSPEEYERARHEAAESALRLPPGMGRPTKKLRRQLERIFSNPPSSATDSVPFDDADPH